MLDKPLVSIIIPTFNSERFIGTCLQSIYNQKYKNFEIIIVDQESTDKTRVIAEKFNARFILTKKPKFYSPPSRSRNRGAKFAKGDILYHLDSDMSLSTNLLNEVAEIFNKHKEIGALIVHEKDIVKGFWSKCKALERRCYWGNDEIESARIVRKEIFEKIKGYDEKISSGEDFDIHDRYKKICKIAFCKNLVYHNLSEFSFFHDIKKKFNYGKTSPQYFQKKQRSIVSILVNEFGCYLKNYKLLFKKPVTALGMILLKLSETASGGLAYLMIRYKNN